jgi:8-oxo-dGTP pyrophosphatase MutT (NUDIX family)
LNEKADKRVVAAVTYRRKNGAVEFLLVKTKHGDKWTFPKGHVKRGESGADAAGREAREEAGVDGLVSDTPFAVYAYPDSSDHGGERLVAAYLLEVVSQTSPDRKEKGRDPTWFDPETAKRRLAEGGREQRYSEEHARIIDLALSQMRANPVHVRPQNA